MIAFSYYHLWFSQNARGYTGLLFWTLLASWFLVRGMLENRPWLWIGYAIAAALGVYTHLTMGFVVIGHFVVYVIAFVVRHAENEKDKMEAWHKLAERTARKLPILGLMTSPGKVIYVKDGFKNVPELALAGWIAHEPSNSCPEVFFKDSKVFPY